MEEAASRANVVGKKFGMLTVIRQDGWKVMREQRVSMRCPLLGIAVFSGKGKMSNSSPTLDRIVPSKGYVQGNVWVISQLANRMKSDLTVAQLRHFLHVIELEIGNQSTAQR